MPSRRSEAPDTGSAATAADLFDPRSIRFRITAVATVAVAAVLIAGSMALIPLQRDTLAATIDDALDETWSAIVADLALRGPGDRPIDRVSDGFAQLVGPEGSVVASTSNLAGTPALPIAAGRSGADTYSSLSGLDVDDDEFRVLSRPSSLGMLHVGMSADVIGESTAALVAALSAIVPLLVVALALIVWWLVGRTLRPVEAIRAEVAAVGATDLHRRVPVPPSGDEIARLAATMNAMLERVEDSVARQRAFVGDASHELRGPLTRMRSSIEVELAHPRSPAGSDVLGSVHEDVLDLQRLVDDLLWLAQAESGSLPNAAHVVDLDDIVLREGERLRREARVRVDMSAISAAEVNGDTGQLTRLVRNLLDNAARYAASRIDLSLSADEAEAVFTVRDDGPGVPLEESERIFERFSRLDEARTAVNGGSGLGLAIARGIAERHGGRLVLLRTDEDGATFELRLPRLGL